MAARREGTKTLVPGMPQNIYDQTDFFLGYSRLQRSVLGLAGAPEWPALRAMLPPLSGLRVLDLGCGFGAFARWAREAGAVSVLGVDLSENMLARARAETHDAAVVYRRGDIEQLELDADSFDVVYSSLALHYVANLAAVCALVRRVLTAGGAFVFSVEHPVFTAPRHPVWQRDAAGVAAWPLNHYLDESARVTDWIAPGVVKQHRCIATYVNTLLDHGMRLTRLVEWAPDATLIAHHPDWADEPHRPPFLLIGAQRP
jgi:ubiquinone/menaquinone biosynthesis C-methylase UbiE